MARESTIKLMFDLSGRTWITSTLDAITNGATTIITMDALDAGMAATPIAYAKNGYLWIDGTGWESLDGKLHVISAADGTARTVTISTDTSAETAPLPASLTGVTVKYTTWTDVCLSEFTPNPATPSEIDATTMCDTERVNLPGLPGAGTASFTGMFDLDDPGMIALRDAQADAVERWLVAKTRGGQLAMFFGVVSSFTMGALGIEQAIPFTGTMTLKKSPTYGRTVP
jgi:hypothetical protein